MSMTSGDTRVCDACCDWPAGDILCVRAAQVATILPTPTVYPSTNMVYLTASPRLLVNGTNFNTKETQLFFSPPLKDGVDVSIFVSAEMCVFFFFWFSRGGVLCMIGQSF